MVSVFFRTILIYMFLLLTMRLMGKRQVGELQISELIVTFMLSELAVNPISDPDMPLLQAIIPIVLLLSIEGGLSFWMTKSGRVKKLLSGTPAVLVKRGELDLQAMADNRIELDELLSEMRQMGIGDPSEISYAVLEKNGKISLFPKAGEGPMTYKDWKNKPKEKGIAHAVVMDGEMEREEMALAEVNGDWIERELRGRGLVLADVFLMTVDDTGGIYLVERKKKG